MALNHMNPFEVPLIKYQVQSPGYKVIYKLIVNME